MVKPLNERQLFRMKRVNLEKRINQYFLETQDSEAVIEYSMAILIFNAITMTNYSFVCKDLIKEIFLTKEPTDKMRDYCLYFYDFFEFDEWEVVRDRLFKSRAEFSEWTRAIRPDTKLVRAVSAPTNKKRQQLYEKYSKSGESRNEPERYYYYFDLVFKDNQGKKHKQKFKNADIDMSKKKLSKLLVLLTKLTIFEKDGVRRFFEVVFPECQTGVGTRYFADEAEDAAYLERMRIETETL